MNFFGSIWETVQVFFWVFVASIPVIIIGAIISSAKESGAIDDFTDKHKLRREKWPDGLYVRKRVEEDGYILRRVHWKYENQDRTRDRHAESNELEPAESYAVVGDDVIYSSSPLPVVVGVKMLRNRYGQSFIPKCTIEEQKFARAVARQIHEQQFASITDIIQDFMFSPTDFEEYCAGLFRRDGYDARTTSRTNDGGYDIVMTKNGKKTIVECKCYDQNNKIGRPLIQKLVGANQSAKADKMIFITTSDYSKEAVEYAKEQKVKLLNGADVFRMMVRLRVKGEEVPVIPRGRWEVWAKDIDGFYPPDYISVDVSDNIVQMKNFYRLFLRVGGRKYLEYFDETGAWAEEATYEGVDVLGGLFRKLSLSERDCEDGGYLFDDEEPSDTATREFADEADDSSADDVNTDSVSVSEADDYGDDLI